jgi:hypothetical protein
MEPLLGYYDSSTGVTPIVNKLLHYLQEKWTSSAIKYMKEHHIAYPPFTHFFTFLRYQSHIRNNPSFQRKSMSVEKRTVCRKTRYDAPREIQNSTPHNNGNSVIRKCPLHNLDHQLNKCRTFRYKTIQERTKFLRERSICFQCCALTTHYKKDCKEIVLCKMCNSNTHPKALHVDISSAPLQTDTSNYSGEDSLDISSKYCKIHDELPGKSCAKILLANVYLKNDTNTQMIMYVMLDDQSNHFLASPRLFDSLGVEGQKINYRTSGFFRVSQILRKRGNLVHFFILLKLFFAI